MNPSSLLAALIMGSVWFVINAVVCQALFQVDLLSMEGLKYFKANNLTKPGIAQGALDDLTKSAKRALANPKPYSVVNTSQTPPNGDKHQYYSWAPYFHADCSKVNNPENPMNDCLYVREDGVYSPDLNLLTDPADSGHMIKDVMALTLYYYLYEDEKYAAKAVQLLQTWFINPTTSMIPSVEYSQVVRGPPGPKAWTGRVEGILDMRYYIYIPACVELLSNSNSMTPSLIDGMKNWITQYANWLLTSKLGQGAKSAANNHATFYVVQIATYLSWTSQNDKAVALISEFENKQFQNQIVKSGNQPLESKRTRSFHYQAFNLIALTYVARLSVKLNATNMWEVKTKEGATIQTAIDYVIDQGTFDKESSSYFLTPLYAAKVYYGDPTGKYSKTLLKLVATGSASDQWWMLWSPLALSDVRIPDNSTANNNPTANNNSSSSSGNYNGSNDNNSTDDDMWNTMDDGGGYTPSGASSDRSIGLLCYAAIWTGLFALFL